MYRAQCSLAIYLIIAEDKENIVEQRRNKEEWLPESGVQDYLLIGRILNQKEVASSITTLWRPQ